MTTVDYENECFFGNINDITIVRTFSGMHLLNSSTIFTVRAMLVIVCSGVF